MAAARVHAGYRQLHVYLKREGWLINHKRLYRLYIEEGLGLRRRRPKRRRSAARRVEQPRPASANETWAMDFMHDTLADGMRSVNHLISLSAAITLRGNPESRRFRFPLLKFDALHEQPHGKRSSREKHRQKEEVGCVCRRQDECEVLRDKPQAGDHEKNAENLWKVV